MGTREMVSTSVRILSSPKRTSLVRIDTRNETSLRIDTRNDKTSLYYVQHRKATRTISSGSVDRNSTDSRPTSENWDGKTGAIDPNLNEKRDYEAIKSEHVNGIDEKSVIDVDKSIDVANSSLYEICKDITDLNNSPKTPARNGDVDHNDNLLARPRNKSVTQFSTAGEKEPPPMTLGSNVKVSLSMDGLYENGKLYKQLNDSDTERPEWASRSLTVSSKTPCPKKPKRTLKFDKDRCTFIKGSSVDDAFTGSDNKLLMSQEEFNAFIESEKLKYSGEVDRIDVSLGSNVNLTDLAPWVKEAYLDRLLSKEPTKIKRNKTSDSITSSKLSDNVSGTFSFANSVDSALDVDSFSSVRSSHVVKVEKQLDTQIEMLETLLNDISINMTQNESSIVHENDYDDLPSESDEEVEISQPPLADDTLPPSVRKELPSIPEEHKNFQRNNLRSTLKNARRRIVRKEGTKITLPFINISFRWPKRMRFKPAESPSNNSLSNSHVELIVQRKPESKRRR